MDDLTSEFLKYSNSNKSLTLKEKINWESICDGRKYEILMASSKKEIATQFTIFFALHKFPNPQSKQTVKISLQRMIPKVFPGYVCRISGCNVTIDELRSNEMLNNKGRVINITD